MLLPGDPLPRITPEAEAVLEIPAAAVAAKRASSASTAAEASAAAAGEMVGTTELAVLGRVGVLASVSCERTRTVALDAWEGSPAGTVSCEWESPPLCIDAVTLGSAADASVTLVRVRTGVVAGAGAADPDADPDFEAACAAVPKLLTAAENDEMGALPVLAVAARVGCGGGDA